ncbi:hypothetical protein AMECASPLE_039834 [Ameca splendens]|uniref:BHLH domain-containing protein n=1 Tax=Ameca splendens TaxID=208324 RepID=A0ABV0Y8Y6_9TELE
MMHHRNNKVMFFFVCLFVFYNRELLINISKAKIILQLQPQIPDELKRRHCAFRAGAKRRERRKKFRSSLSLIMGYVRSLGNELDEVQALQRTQRLCLHLPPVCLKKSGEDATGETEPE